MKLFLKILFCILNIIIFTFVVIFVVKSVKALKLKNNYSSKKGVIETYNIPFVDIRKIYVKNDKIVCLNEQFSTIMIFDQNGKHEKNITLPFYEKGENAIYYVKDILCAVDRGGNLYEFKNNQLKYIISSDYEKKRINIFLYNGRLIKSYNVDTSNCFPYFYEDNQMQIVEDSYKCILNQNEKYRIEKFDYNCIYSKNLDYTYKNSIQYVVEGIKPELKEIQQGKTKILLKESWFNWFLYSDKADSIIIVGIFVIALLQLLVWKLMRIV